MTMRDFRAARLTRREAISLLGMGAGAGLVTALGKDAGLAAARQATSRSGQNLAAPKGAIIRTILRDVPPEGVGSGATLFHEHLLLSQTPPAKPVA